MNNTLKKILTVLLMVIFATLVTGCESQDEKFKRLESEFYDLDKVRMTNVTKAIDTIDVKMYKKECEAYIEKGGKLIDELEKAAKGNVEYQKKADEWKRGYQSIKIEMSKYKDKDEIALSEDLREIRFYKLKKQLGEITSRFYALEEKYAPFWDKNKDTESFAKAVREYVAAAGPIIEEMNKLAPGNKTRMKEMEDQNRWYNKNKNKI